MRAAAVATLMLLAGPVWAASFRDKACDYFDLNRNLFENGPCKMQDTQINEHFAYIMTFASGTKVTIEYLASQSGMHTWLINGRPGMGFEKDRDHLVGGTSDLKQSVAW